LLFAGILAAVTAGCNRPTSRAYRGKGADVKKIVKATKKPPRKGAFRDGL
jgi:hypothetical protein